MSAEREEGGFLGRWSARKRRPDADAPDAAPPAFGAGEEPSRPSATLDGSAHIVATPSPTGASTSQEPVGGGRVEAPGPDPDSGSDADEPAEPPSLTDIDMPPVESLDASSDLSGFFSKGVSASLRRAALRHVFSQPSYNVRDGLNDYDGDYTVFEPLGDTVTSDMKFHAARHERERLRREAEAEAEGRIETSSTNEAGSSDDTGADGADPGGTEPNDMEPDRSAAGAEHEPSVVERGSTAEAVGNDGERESGTRSEDEAASREDDGTSRPEVDAAAARDELSGEGRAPRKDAFRDAVASNVGDGRPLNGRRAGADEDEEGAGHG